MTLSAGTRLGPYEVVDLLGAGGMGEVYRARDPRLGREVAVKVLPADVVGDPAKMALFEREARAVAALNHPNILTVHDVGAHAELPYVVTELLEGETLGQAMSRRTWTPPEVLSYMLQAARGLEAAHARGIVHRDLKPENLFLTSEGRVKVLDFGLAKAMRQTRDAGSEVTTAHRHTAPGQVMGTVLYMSPEQARGQPVDTRSDVFSFGVVLYEFLGRRHPFRRNTMAATLTAILVETPPDLESLDRGSPPWAGPSYAGACGSRGRTATAPATRLPWPSRQSWPRRRGRSYCVRSRSAVPTPGSRRSPRGTPRTSSAGRTRSRRSGGGCRRGTSWL